MVKLFSVALKSQYARAMREAYAFARAEAVAGGGANVLDCGCGRGVERIATFGRACQEKLNYIGLEWNQYAVAEGRSKGLEIVRADLNLPLPIETDSQDCAIAFSVLEHLLMPCSFMNECHRVLKMGGRLVILTPNISTYFTALQVILGKMPSSGPHPDSNRLLDLEQPVKVTDFARDDVTAETPQHRHLVVFSMNALRRFLVMSGFTVRHARGFGYYPMPIRLQPWFERVDPSHCHQMVLVCEKSS